MGQLAGLRGYAEFPGRESAVPSHHLIGRAAELAELALVLEEAAGGRGGTVFIEGEGGIGKTALITHVLGEARRRGFGVVASAADEREPGIEATQAMLAAGVQRCARGPVAVAVEDLQWADAATLALVQRLAVRVARDPLVVLCSRRLAPTSLELGRLVARTEGRGARRLRLRPFSEAELAGFARSVVGATPGPRLLARLARAGGNPLVAGEMLEALRGGGLWPPADQPWR